MKEISVWIAAWQMQCCGDEFGIGSKVEWNVVPRASEVPSADGAGAIDYYYDHHTDTDISLLKGTAAEIYSVYERYERDESAGVLVSVSSKRMKCTGNADGWHKDMGDYRFSAYPAQVTDYEICEIKQAERG